MYTESIKNYDKKINDVKLYAKINKKALVNMDDTQFNRFRDHKQFSLTFTDYEVLV